MDIIKINTKTRITNKVMVKIIGIIKATKDNIDKDNIRNMDNKWDKVIKE